MQAMLKQRMQAARQTAICIAAWAPLRPYRLHKQPNHSAVQVLICKHLAAGTDAGSFLLRYMPAELLLEGKMTKAADVYGFAMMAWELFAGEQLFKGLRQSQVAILS